MVSRAVPRRPPATAPQHPARLARLRRANRDTSPHHAFVPRESARQRVIEPARLVTCGDCSDPFELSQRSRTPHPRSTPRCARCRYGAKQPEVTDAMRRWWLARYSRDEIREMAAGVWPSSRV